MQHVSDCMKKLSGLQKDEWWQKIQKRRFEEAEKADDFGNAELRNLICIELDGGKCPRCKKQWRKIEFNNTFGKGFYHRPNCDCFYRCPNCDRELFDEMLRKILEKNNYHCPHCRWLLVKDDKKLWGYNFEIWLKETSKNNPYKIYQLKVELGMIKETSKDKGE